MKIKNVALLFTALITLASCTNYAVKVGVMRAPEIVIPGTKRLSVDQFEVFDESTHSALVGLTERHRKLLQDAISDDLTFELAHSDSTGPRIGGRLTFTSSLNTPKFARNEEVSDDGEEKDTSESSGKDSPKKQYITITYYEVTRTATLHVDLEVSDSLGNIIGASKITLSDSSTYGDKSLPYALHKVGSANALWEGLMRSSVSQIMNSITVGHTKEYRYFEKVKKNKRFKVANMAAFQGDWNYALGIWETEAALSPIAKAASLYNKSIYYESIGDLKTAGELIEEALEIELNRRYVYRLYEIRRLNREAKIIENNY